MHVMDMPTHVLPLLSVEANDIIDLFLPPTINNDKQTLE